MLENQPDWNLPRANDSASEITPIGINTKNWPYLVYFLEQAGLIRGFQIRLILEHQGRRIAVSVMQRRQTKNSNHSPGRQGKRLALAVIGRTCIDGNSQQERQEEWRARNLLRILLFQEKLTNLSSAACLIRTLLLQPDLSWRRSGPH